MFFNLEVIQQLKAAGKKVDYLEQAYLDRYFKQNPGVEVNIFEEKDYSTDNHVKLSNLEVLQMQIFGHTVSFKDLEEYAKSYPNLVNRYWREKETI